MEWMILPLKRYFDFRGRSRRKEFWMWVLFVLIVAVILSFVDRALGLGGSGTTLGTTREATPVGTNFSSGLYTRGGLLTGIFSLAVLVPNLAVSVRRLHDIDRTGWWVVVPILPYLIGIFVIVIGFASQNSGMAAIGGVFFLIGIIGAIVLIVFYCLDGTNGPNRFGPDPKGQDLSETFS